MKIYHYFIPHPQTHKKTPFLSAVALLVYILIFLGLQLGFKVTNQVRPGVLGINSEVTVSNVIEQTNKARAEKGLPPLLENHSLDQAALTKGENMFAENYWAHYSPSGKDPWSFIKGSGYKFSYAGENLAKNFYTTDDLLSAWLASPSHRDNIFNSHYQDIGIAVVEGNLNGQRTTIVVQMFGSPFNNLAAKPIEREPNLQQPPPELSPVLSQPVSIAGAEKASSQLPAVDPNLINKIVAAFLILLIGTLLSIDYLVLRRRGVFRFSSHHLAHLSFLAITMTTIFTQTAGEII